MKLSRFLTEGRIKLEMDTVVVAPAEGVSLERWRQESKRLIISELVELLEQNSRIGNRTKLTNDFINREKKASATG